MSAARELTVGDVVTLTAVLQRIRAHRLPSWAAGTVLVDAHQAPARFRGALLDVSGGLLGRAEVGETLRLTGTLQLYRDDLQLRIDEQESLGIQSPDAAHEWLQRLPSVGPGRARRLARTFPDQRLLEVLNTNPEDPAADPLLEVEGVGPQVAADIRAGWRELSKRFNPQDLAYLGSLGALNRTQLNTVLDHVIERGISAEELLERDPYATVELRGIGWITADKLARAAGVSRTAPARIDAATVHYLGELVDDEGHTAISRRELVARVCSRLNVEGRLVGEAVGRLKGAGRLEVTEEDGVQLVHLPRLLEAERLLWELVTGQAERGSVAEWLKRSAGAHLPSSLEFGAGGRAVVLDEDGEPLGSSKPNPAFAEKVDAACERDPLGGDMDSWT